MSPLWFLDGFNGELFLDGEEWSRLVFKLLFKLVVVTVPRLPDVDDGLLPLPALPLILLLLLPNLPNRLPFLPGADELPPPLF